MLIQCAGILTLPQNYGHGWRVLIYSIDVKASGPIPGEYSMLSIGACIVGNTKKRFYVELKPLNGKYVKQALKVCGLSMKKLKREGVEPEDRDESSSRSGSAVRQKVACLCSARGARWTGCS